MCSCLPLGLEAPCYSFSFYYILSDIRNGWGLRGTDAPVWGSGGSVCGVSTILWIPQATHAVCTVLLRGVSNSYIVYSYYLASSLHVYYVNNISLREGLKIFWELSAVPTETSGNIYTFFCQALTDFFFLRFIIFKGQCSMLMNYEWVYMIWKILKFPFISSSLMFIFYLPSCTVPCLSQ